MYISDERIMRCFYKVTKRMVESMSGATDDNDWYNLTEKMAGMVSLVEEILKEEE